MNIVIIICTEDEGLDPESLLGHIAITDGAQAIRERYTYIDSWLDALVRGVQAIRERSHCVIDLIDEPDPLVFDLSKNGLYISYGKAAINVGTIGSFAAGLRSAAALFLETVHEEAGVTSETLKSIHVFVSNDSGNEGPA